ncbi:13988_t:CDS:2, partial [Racocetra fulgida]
EPEEFRPPSPKETFEKFERKAAHISSGIQNTDDPQTFNIRLVGFHPLWAHQLWNASKCVAWYLDEHKELISNKNVLELGAGGALPSLISFLNGAKKVVITDYPDENLIENIEYNVMLNLSSKGGCNIDNIKVLGYIWGKNTGPLLDAISSQQNSQSITKRSYYDLIILSDLIFNHSQHSALLKTCEECLDIENGQVLVFFTHHRPSLAYKDMEFFEKAKANGLFRVEKIFETVMKPMFENDSGCDIIRSTIHGYIMTRQKINNDIV